MNDERTSKELAGIVRDDFLWLEGVAGAPHGQAVLAALDELVRRADEAAVYKRALEILASDGGLWNEANAAKRLRAVLREARKELGL